MKHLSRALAALIGLSFSAGALAIDAATATSGDFSAVPPLLSRSSSPKVMLAMSVDHQLFIKAYSDYSDLDGDGALDLGYNDAFEYYGYFDSQWCYDYVSGDTRFEPSVKVDGAFDNSNHACTNSSSDWSGNFLNWATMTRMDVLRKILYGGARSLDTATTVLERAYLPEDVHAFSKVYSGASAASFTPLSNGSAITLCNLSTSSTGAPKVRVATGAWPRWGASESQQCQWNEDGGKTTQPEKADQITANIAYDLNNRVLRCVNAKDGANPKHCKTYANGDIKPVGLLQNYGEAGEIEFGLISGSYAKRDAGGVLRKNISKIAANVDSALDEVNLTNGRFTSVQGIIRSIDDVRIANYNHGSGNYSDCDHHSITVSEYTGAIRGDNDYCSDWGNPIAEIYLEALRYFSAAGAATSAFTTISGSSSLDQSYVASLTEKSWLDPLSVDEVCANCSIMLLSSGLNSFDRDDLGSAADIQGLTGSGSVDTVTNSVGDLEAGGSFNGSYLSGGSDEQCVARNLANLADANGICPEQPQLQGGYHAAGLALHGKITDLRTGLEDIQNVSSYVVQMSESLPSFTVPVGSGELRFLPVCQSNKNSASLNDPDWQTCSLTDVKVVSQSVDGSGNASGSLLFFWEDSLWGNDYDIDGIQRIEYCVGDACGGGVAADEVRFTSALDYAYAGNNLRFSYVLSGSTDDGLYSGNGSGSGWLERPGGAGTNFNAFAGELDNVGAQPSDIVATFSQGSDSASMLKNPLWYTAKYGGFNDLDNDSTPLHDSGDNREWDAKNNLDGTYAPDGEPDNYFLVNNPAQLDAQMRQVFDGIVSRTTSGTNAAVVSNSNTGDGAVYQALYQPKVSLQNRFVTWVGMLHALFIDSAGRLREDSNGNDHLDSADLPIEIYFDAALGKTLIQRYSIESDGSLLASGAAQDLAELKTIWDARDQLALVPNPQTQRAYSAIDGNRHIFTYLDLDADESVDAGETLAFTATTFPSSGNAYYEYLAVTASQSEDLVNYIRGDDTMPAFRSRTIDYDQDGVDEVWRLGDIVHSTPAIVGTPNADYLRNHRDESYRAFWTRYENRRQMIYNGANDGMLHAFNGGFWEANDKSFETALDGESAHALGAELWAYVPQALLPHLRWLGEMSYEHVYYIDGEPLVFDANIFSADTDHPNGWGTVLVVGMRLGGGEQTVSIGGNDQDFRSGYIVMDVTNPEVAPKLLAEISHPNMGLTSSKPALIKARAPYLDQYGSPDWSQTPLVNEWYLAIGSGPIGAEALSAAESDQTGKLFIYDLQSLDFVTGLDGVDVASSGDNAFASSYLGDMTVVDWNSDYVDDVVYFGTVNADVSGSNNSLTGNLKRLLLSYDDFGLSDASAVSNLLDSDKPMVAAPMTLVDPQNRAWVYAGSGRLSVAADNSNSEQQNFYGLKEPIDTDSDSDTYGQRTYATVSRSALIDSTATSVFTDGVIQDYSSGTAADIVINSSTIGTFDALVTEMGNHPGWTLRLEHGSSLPAGRNVSKANRLFDAIYFTQYLPPAQQCSIDGESFLHAIDYRTGTASIDSPLYSSADLVHDGEERILASVSLGVGMASEPVFHRGADGTTHVITQTSTGELNLDNLHVESRGGRMSWRQIY